MTKRALISGISGQDGSYLAEFLLAKGYDVHGIVRRPLSDRFDNIEHLRGKITLHQADLTDPIGIHAVVFKCCPDEVYNLGGQTFVPASWANPGMTSSATGLGALHMLEAVRQTNPHHTRFYQASSSEMFGNATECPQNEQTPFHPRSPYGVAKVYAHHLTVNYRESYGMHASCGILFNHESPRRPLHFVTRKITDAVARIKLGLQENLALGNLIASRDWGFAGDYVEAMWLMLQQDHPDDYVVATGKSTTVHEFATLAHKFAGVKSDFGVPDESLIRPAEINHLYGDSTKFREKTGWKPKVSLQELIEMMVAADLVRLAAKTMIMIDGEPVEHTRCVIRWTGNTPALYRDGKRVVKPWYVHMDENMPADPTGGNANTD